MADEKDNCLFCKIVKKEIPTDIVFETENVMAFLDIEPISPGHILVIPKQHFFNLLDLPEQIGAEMLAVSKVVAYSQIEALGAEGFSLLERNFPAAGQLVMHVHWHIIPRFQNDGIEEWHGKKYYN